MKQSLIIQDIGPSFNEYQNIYYKKRGALVRRWVNTVSWEAKAQGIKPVTDYPVTIHCICTFGHKRRSFDWVNLSVTAKLIEDGLRECGILKDDSKKFISWGKLESIKTKGETFTEFIIESLNDAGNSAAAFVNVTG